MCIYIYTHIYIHVYTYICSESICYSYQPQTPTQTRPSLTKTHPP